MYDISQFKRDFNMNFKINLLAFSILLMFTNLSFSQSTLLDDFEDLSNWQKIVSDGVSMHLSIVDGYKGKCIKLDYEFKGSGYCGIQKNISLNLPQNYKFSYYLKANSPNNNLEFKLTDSTGDNVWWLNQRNLEFPTQWQRDVSQKKRYHFCMGAN